MISSTSLGFGSVTIWCTDAILWQPKHETGHSWRPGERTTPSSGHQLSKRWKCSHSFSTLLDIHCQDCVSSICSWFQWTSVNVRGRSFKDLRKMYFAHTDRYLDRAARGNGIKYNHYVLGSFKINKACKILMEANGIRAGGCGRKGLCLGCTIQWLWLYFLGFPAEVFIPYEGNHSHQLLLVQAGSK